MSYENLKYDKKEQIATITIDRPKVLNALNMATMEELRQAFTEARDDKDVRVVLLTGEGEKSFVAGADISELAMASTFRLASDNAKIGQPEVKLGILPGYGGSQRLPRLVGKGLAMQMLLTGDHIPAAEAHRIGLVNEVVPQAELLPRAEAIAKKIIANAPLAVQYCMEAVHRGMEMSQAEGLYLEATLFGLCCATEDKKEGTTAFLEKRAAAFKGK